MQNLQLHQIRTTKSDRSLILEAFVRPNDQMPTKHLKLHRKLKLNILSQYNTLSCIELSRIISFNRNSGKDESFITLFGIVQQLNEQQLNVDGIFSFCQLQ